VSESVIVGLYARRRSRVARRYTPREYLEDTVMAVEIDPVCGMQVDPTTSLLSYDYEGTTYWFCSKGCLLEFKDDPGKYLDPDYVPSM
jgi:YHS domain-containing protein